jgi:RHS repeat-associated protein
MSGDVDTERLMNADSNFVYDADGNMIYDASKKMTVNYDYRGLPTAFAKQELSGDSVRLLMTYDGSGTRISKRYERKNAGETAWTLQLATHYTGLGSEIRENGLDNTAKVVVNLPQGLGRYGVENAVTASATTPGFEWYLKNHLGSTMLVYGTGTGSGSVKAAYDYRAFGEQIDLTISTDKVTETFTGKERDDETDLGYFGARYLDQMLGMWVSVDTKRQFASPYLYAGNGVNPINVVDPNGEKAIVIIDGTTIVCIVPTTFVGDAATSENISRIKSGVEKQYSGQFGEYKMTTKVVEGDWNTVNLDARRGTSNASGAEGKANIMMGNDFSIWSSLHEFGHLLGLDDQYDFDPMSQKGIPKEGFEENIMGKNGALGVTPGQVEETFEAEGNTVYEKQ